jgi:cytochrome c6
MPQSFGRVIGIVTVVSLAGGMTLATQVAASPQFAAKETYLDKCAVCHGADGMGKTAKGKKAKVKDVNETVKKMSEVEMLKIVQDGKAPNMDSFKKDFTPEQVKALVQYYRTLAK